MSRLRLASRLILLCAILVAIPALIVSNLATRGEIGHAKNLYNKTRQDLESTDGRLSQSEARLRRLTTSAHAVEIEARSRFRLVRPGETLVLIEKE